ncbi:hypothetical protein B0J13DRAFT_557322 [Dactylonectria estremocensis]|uniref:RING-type domain-containing protein n=1 Tax=Dactylonectria estremocensis TaxID=1079267 RepID=A0A9P9J3R2_9HYPO|nr:hypothetical protein B0J13DRAFT_557322 [Dactylonectria estremocensis]
MTDDHECCICYRVFESPSALARHARATSHRPYRCNSCCTRGFRTAEALEQHGRDRRLQIESIRRDGRATLRPHPCPECPRSFDTAAALEQHRTDAPGHGSERHCAQCDRTFNSVEALSQHKRDSPAHRSEPRTWRSCGLCDRTFDSILEYIQHLDLSHSAPNPLTEIVPTSDPTGDLQRVVMFEYMDPGLPSPIPSMDYDQRLMAIMDEWNYGGGSTYLDHQDWGLDTHDGRGRSRSWAGSPTSSIHEGEDAAGPEVTVHVDAGPITGTPPRSPGDAPGNATAQRNIDVPGNPDSTSTADVNDTPFGPLTLEEHLEALEAELRSVKETLAQTKCSMCYDKPRDTVAKCGHVFCGSCVDEWQSQHRHAFNAPCPMCRKAMGRPIKMFAA